VISKDWQKINRYSRKFSVFPDTLDEVAVDVFAWERGGTPLWMRNPDSQSSFLVIEAVAD
jgi:hypothetical protein